MATVTQLIRQYRVKLAHLQLDLENLRDTIKAGGYNPDNILKEIAGLLQRKDAILKSAKTLDRSTHRVKLDAEQNRLLADTERLELVIFQLSREIRRLVNKRR